MFLGRHQLKFGGRWLYQQQGFSYSGNEGILGHFNYSGTFTGFGFADFLLDQVSLKGRGGVVSPFTHLQHRVGVFAQDDFRVSDDLTLNLGLAWEYTSPLVEKDDRQSNIDLNTGALLLAGQNGNSRALYDPYYGGFEPRVGAAWTPSDKWVVRGGFGIVQYMEGTGKNLRLPANPPFNFEGQRSFDATTGAGTAAIGFDDVTPNTSGGPGTLYRIFAPDLRPQLTKQWNIFVERQAHGFAVGADRLCRQPFEPHGRAVRFQPAGTRSRSGRDLAAAGRASSAPCPEPGPGHADERHQLDWRRQVRRPAGQPAPAADRWSRVPRLVHLWQGAQRQRRLLRRGLGPDGGPGLLLHGQHRSAPRLRPLTV